MQKYKYGSLCFVLELFVSLIKIIQLVILKYKNTETNKNMANSKNKNRLHWSQEEDQKIRTMHEQFNISSWKKISKELNRAQNGKKRSPKQCRQRYMNFIKFCQQSSNNQWIYQEEKVLFQAFLMFGPKWVKIADKINNKSQNSIKNKFYGTLRKFLRKMNRIEKSKGLKGRKQIKYQCLLKFISILNPENISDYSQRLASSRVNYYLQVRYSLLKTLSTFSQKYENVNKQSSDQQEFEKYQNHQHFLHLSQKLHEFSSETRFISRGKNKTKLNSSRALQNQQFTFKNIKQLGLSRQQIFLQSDKRQSSTCKFPTESRSAHLEIDQQDTSKQNQSQKQHSQMQGKNSHQLEQKLIENYEQMNAQQIFQLQPIENLLLKPCLAHQDGNQQNFIMQKILQNFQSSLSQKADQLFNIFNFCQNEGQNLQRNHRSCRNIFDSEFPFEHQFFY